MNDLEGALEDKYEYYSLLGLKKEVWRSKIKKIKFFGAFFFSHLFVFLFHTNNFWV